MEKVTAIIPAYNEEKHIGRVLSVLEKVDKVNEVIVVDDGSEDRTKKVSKSFEQVKVVSHGVNRGKKEALNTGVKHSKDRNLLFLDADLVNLEEKHITSMLTSFFESEKETMVLGIFKDRRRLTDFAMVLHPKLTGQRVLTKKVWETAYKKKSKGFGAEVAINKACEDLGIPVKRVNLYGVTQHRKEEKEGWIKGLIYKASMYLQVIYTLIKNIKPSPKLVHRTHQPFQ